MVEFRNPLLMYCMHHPHSPSIPFPFPFPFPTPLLSLISLSHLQDPTTATDQGNYRFDFAARKEGRLTIVSRVLYSTIDRKPLILCGCCWSRERGGGKGEAGGRYWCWVLVWGLPVSREDWKGDERLFREAVESVGEVKVGVGGSILPGRLCTELSCGWIARSLERLTYFGERRNQISAKQDGISRLENLGCLGISFSLPSQTMLQKVQ